MQSSWNCQKALLSTPPHCEPQCQKFEATKVRGSDPIQPFQHHFVPKNLTALKPKKVSGSDPTFRAPKNSHARGLILSEIGRSHHSSLFPSSPGRSAAGFPGENPMPRNQPASELCFIHWHRTWSQHRRVRGMQCPQCSSIRLTFPDRNRRSISPTVLGASTLLRNA